MSSREERDGGAPHPDRDTVDREHRVQIGLLDALTAAVKKGRPEPEIREIHRGLLDYSRVHFLSEQLLMRLHAYPDHDRHLADHEEMISALEAFGEALDGDGIETSLPEMDRLRAFLLGHIEGRDRELADHLAARGVGGAAG